MVDRYEDDLKRSKDIVKELQDTFKQRSSAASSGQPTSRYDYKIKSKLASLKQEQIGLEKLAYLYGESDSTYNAISSGEKKKRTTAINKFMSESKTLQNEIAVALGHK